MGSFKFSTPQIAIQNHKQDSDHPKAVSIFLILLTLLLQSYSKWNGMTQWTPRNLNLHLHASSTYASVITITVIISIKCLLIRFGTASFLVFRAFREGHVTEVSLSPCSSSSRHTGLNELVSVSCSWGRNTAASSSSSWPRRVRPRQTAVSWSSLWIIW